jgi:hypothetical protein
MSTLFAAFLLVALSLDGPAGANAPLGGGAIHGAQQETRKVPSDSVEVEARGCLKGRVFTGTGQPDEEKTSKGPDVTGKSFRVTGERDVMDLVKKYNGQYVEILGIVRKAALDDQGVGMRVGRRGRVVIGAPGVDPTRMNAPAAAPSVAAMDAIAVRLLSDRCPLQ